MLLYCESGGVVVYCTGQAKVVLKTFTKTEKLPCHNSTKLHKTHRHQSDPARTNLGGVRRLGERRREDVGGGEKDAAVVHQLQCFRLHKGWDGGPGCDLRERESSVGRSNDKTQILTSLIEAGRLECEDDMRVTVSESEISQPKEDKLSRLRLWL